LQGASAEEIQQHLYSCSLKDAVKDDPRGFATLFPGDNPDLPDISATPNRLLHKMLDRVRPTATMITQPATLTLQLLQHAVMLVVQP
jgi:hypothetical protein